jgi:hypothetical protein
MELGQVFTSAWLRFRQAKHSINILCSGNWPIYPRCGCSDFARAEDCQRLAWLPLRTPVGAAVYRNGVNLIVITGVYRLASRPSNIRPKSDYHVAGYIYTWISLSPTALSALIHSATLSIVRPRLDHVSSSWDEAI